MSLADHALSIMLLIDWFMLTSLTMECTMFLAALGRIGAEWIGRARELWPLTVRKIYMYK